MNIFYLDKDPKVCAQMHVDKHCVKMILEYCQLLSTAHRILDGKEVIEQSKTGRNVKRWILSDEYTHGTIKLNDILYSATHVNHPSAIWCRESLLNYKWLHALLVELCKEYTYRYGKTHKCQEIGLVDALSTPPFHSPHKPFTEPTPAMPDECKVPGDSLTSYRRYYVMNKTHLWSWSGKINSRERPQWLSEFLRKAKESCYATI
jgi:hypothetical protein